MSEVPLYGGRSSVVTTDPLSRSFLRVRLHGECHNESLIERMWFKAPEILFPTAYVDQGTSGSSEKNFGANRFESAWVCVPGPAAGVASVPLAGREARAGAAGVVRWSRGGAQTGRGRHARGKHVASIFPGSLWRGSLSGSLELWSKRAGRGQDERSVGGQDCRGKHGPDEGA
jgi:hypothetical protein